MRPTAALALAAIAATTAALSPTSFFVDNAAATSEARVFEPESMNHDCFEPVPDEASPNALTGGSHINLHVRLVMDLVESRALDAVKDNPKTSKNERQAAIDTFGRKLAADFLAEGMQSYSDIDIKLDFASFDVLHTSDLRSGERAPTMDARTAISLGKSQYGGTRPAGSDVVYVLSDRDLTSPTSPGIVGLADCIGGVHHGTTAFATGELDRDPEINLIAAKVYVEFTAKVAAHEIGHLMGGHHHYQACGPYAATNYLDGYGLGGCTVMTNFVDFISFPFSPTNQLVVRGHAEKYAAANDGEIGEVGGDGHDGHDGDGH